MITGNEPAMPIISQHEVFGTGINIRQYYAGLALQGIISNCSGQGIDGTILSEIFAKQSLIYADALINELNKNETL